MRLSAICPWVVLGSLLRKIAQDSRESVSSQGRKECLEMQPLQCEANMAVGAVPHSFSSHTLLNTLHISGLIAGV